MSDFLRNGKTCENTEYNSENAGYRGGPGSAETEEVGWFAEEDGFLDIASNDPGKEVAIGEDSPEDGRDTDKGERTDKDLGEYRDGTRGCVDLEDVEEGRTLTAVELL